MTFKFVLFTAEEAGLYGSQSFVDNYGESALRADLVYAHTMDMVAYWADPDGGIYNIYNIYIYMYGPAVHMCLQGYVRVYGL